MAPARPYARAQLRRLAVAGTGVLLVAGACRDDRAAPAAAARPAPVVAARNGAGELLLEARITGDRCAVTGAVALSVERSTTPDGPLVTARRDAAVVLTMAAGRAGLELRGADQTSRARVVRGDRRTDVLTPDGVPLARISASADDAIVVDASRAPVATLRRDGDPIAATAADGAALAVVTGTADLELAALLIAPGVPADLRAVLACDRLLAGPSPSSAPAPSMPAAPASPDQAVPDPTP